MLFLPSKFLPKDVPVEHAQAILVTSPSQVNLQPDDPFSFSCNAIVPMDEQVGLYPGQFLVVTWREDGRSHCRLVRRIPDGPLFEVVGDSKRQALFSDEADYLHELALWRPSIAHLNKANSDPLFALALRCKVELDRAAKRPKPAQPKENDDPFWFLDP